jgi:hypothetical protein
MAAVSLTQQRHAAAVPHGSLLEAQLEACHGHEPRTLLAAPRAAQAQRTEGWLEARPPSWHKARPAAQQQRCARQPWKRCCSCLRAAAATRLRRPRARTPPSPALRRL